MYGKQLLTKIASLTLTAMLLVGLPLESTALAAGWTYGQLCPRTILGRHECHGYFTGTNFWSGGITGGNVLTNSVPSSVNSAGSFIRYMEGFLGNNDNYSYDKAGAAFIIDAMLDRNGTSFGSVKSGIHYARTHLTGSQGWEAIVNYYASQPSRGPGWDGWIRWNYSTTLHNATNSMHVNGSQDLTFFNWPPDETSHLIVFQAPGDKPFEIRRECGNIVGDVAKLRQPVTVHTSCGGILIDPGQPDPKAAYALTAAIDYRPQSTQAGTEVTSSDQLFIDITGPGASYHNGNVHMSDSGGTVRGTVRPGATNSTGTYTVHYGLSGAVAPITCTASFTVANEPYFNVVGGDIEAGAGMMVGGGCALPADPKAGILSWNQGSSAYAGAGTQYAAIALADIQDFASAQGIGLAPDGLSFANTSTTPQIGEYGGNFGTEACMPDYYANHPAAPTQLPGTITHLAPGTNALYVVGDETINLSGAAPTVPNDSQTTIYVDGNLTIDSDITFSGVYNSVADIPALTIVVKGNIYISPNVKELDGVYVAEPDVNPITAAATHGLIYTCTTLPFAPTPSDPHLRVDLGSYYQTCDTHLDVYGAVMARQLWLLRTYGTLYQAPPSPAETFHYTPEMWLSLSQPSTAPYDAITSLPPVL